MNKIAEIKVEVKVCELKVLQMDRQILRAKEKKKRKGRR